MRSASSSGVSVHPFISHSRNTLYIPPAMGGVPVEKVAEAIGRLIDDGLIRGWGLSQVDVNVIDAA